MIFWPLFFVSSYAAEPHLKIRNFKKSLLKGANRTMNFRRHPKPSADDMPRRTEDEERPAWDFGTLEDTVHRRGKKKEQYYSQVQYVLRYFVAVQMNDTIGLFYSVKHIWFQKCFDGALVTSYGR